MTNFKTNMCQKFKFSYLPQKTHQIAYQHFKDFSTRFLQHYYDVQKHRMGERPVFVTGRGVNINVSPSVTL